MQTLLREAMENTAREERIKSARRPIRDFLENKIENDEYGTTEYDVDSDQDIASFLRQSLPKIQVFGVGGMGCNATLRLKSLNISGVEIVALVPTAGVVRGAFLGTVVGTVRGTNPNLGVLDIWHEQVVAEAVGSIACDKWAALVGHRVVIVLDIHIDAQGNLLHVA